MRQKMTRILLTYSTTDGQTLRICQRIAQVIEGRGDKVAVISVDENLKLEPGSFDKIVVGASIRYGKHRPQVYEFIARHLHILTNTPSAFFTVNVVARKPGKDKPESNPYLRKFLKQIEWHPDLLGVFAGKINYPIYNFWDRQIIRFIMWMTHGPTDPSAVVEFTDWDQVETFGRRVSEL